jgi:hypothetical protein
MAAGAAWSKKNSIEAGGHKKNSRQFLAGGSVDKLDA